MSSCQDFDIAIVGAGPVGTFLANMLGTAGLDVLLVDREIEIYPLPRAVHFDGEGTMVSVRMIGPAITTCTSPTSKSFFATV